MEVFYSILDVINVRDILDDATASFDNRYEDYGQANLAINNSAFGGGSSSSSCINNGSFMDLESELEVSPGMSPGAAASNPSEAWGETGEGHKSQTMIIE